jgi:hypothetical protein
MRAYLITVAAFVAACSSTGSKGQKELQDLTGEIKTLTTMLTDGKADLQSTMKEHDAIVNNTDGDYVGHYKAYAKGIDRVEKDREGVRKQVQKVKEAAAPYFSRWKDDNAKISDPGLRERDAKNMAATQARYDEIYKNGDAAKAAYDPLMKTLKDHRQFWSNNLNASSAAEMKGDSQALDKQANAFYGLIDKVVESAHQYNASVAMRTSAPSQPK